MANPTIDWAAEAAKFGGKVAVPSSNSQPDWAAEAAKFGGTIAKPATAQAPQPESKIEARTPGLWETVTAPIREGALGRALHISTETAAARAEDSSNPILRFEAAAPQEGAIRGVSKLMSSLTTPENIVLLAGTGGIGNVESAIGKTGLAQLSKLGFSSLMVSNAIQRTPGVVEAIKKGDWAQARELGTQALGELFLGAHGASDVAKFPRTTPAPPVDLMSGRSTLPTPEAAFDATLNATRDTASKLSKAATRKALNSDLVKADPKLGITNVYGSGIDPRVAENFDQIRKDIVTHGGPVENNADIFKSGKAAKDKLDTVLDKEWMQPARDRGQEFSLEPLIQATQDALPYLDRQAAAESTEGKQVARLLQDVRLNYGGRKVTVDQLKDITETLNDKVGKIHKMNAGDRAAAEGSGVPLAILEAQAKAARKTLYEGLDPENAGAGPQEIQRRIGNITGLMQEADKAKIKIALEKPISKAGVVGKVLSTAVSIPGKKLLPALVTADAPKGSILHPVTGPTDALIKRLFMAEGGAEGIPIQRIPELVAPTAPPPLPEPPPTPFKSAEVSAQVFANAPLPKPKSARESATVFQGGATRPIVPETGLPENVARILAGRETLAKELNLDLKALSSQEIIALDKLIAEGYGSARPTSKPPVSSQQ